jgi:hypothetical protein
MTLTTSHFFDNLVSQSLFLWLFIGSCFGLNFLLSHIGILDRVAKPKKNFKGGAAKYSKIKKIKMKFFPLIPKKISNIITRSVGLLVR